MTRAPDNLVIVCGHGIWLGGPHNGWDESEWLIETYKAGETPTFIEHIKAGLRVLSEDSRAVLVFSGGPTRKETRLSEARSYANLAAANGYFGYLAPAETSPMETPQQGKEPLDWPQHPRVLLDERALDSYYNILFSLVAFWRASGYASWPTQLTIVGHGFKRARLVDGHCAAIGFPLDRVAFVGISPPGLEEGKGQEQGSGVSHEKAQVMKGVGATLDHWAEDPHGAGSVLSGKRRARNPWGVDQRLFLSDEERARSGVKTRFTEDGTEVLADGGMRPWAK